MVKTILTLTPDTKTAEAFDAMGAAPVLYDEDVPF